MEIGEIRRSTALASRRFTVDWLDCSRTESHRIIRGGLAVVDIIVTGCGYVGRSPRGIPSAARSRDAING